MAKILIIHGAGMNMRGKVQTEIFGPMTLPEYDERIRGYASELGVEIEIFHSNIEGEVINKLYEANDRGFDAALFNPAGFSRGYPALVAAISQVKFPTIELAYLQPGPSWPAVGHRSGQPRDAHRLRDRRLLLALRGLRDMLVKQPTSPRAIRKRPERQSGVCHDGHRGAPAGNADRAGRAFYGGCDRPQSRVRKADNADGRWRTDA